MHSVNAPENTQRAVEAPDGLLGMLRCFDGNFNDSNIFSPATVAGVLKTGPIVEEKFREIQEPTFLEFLLSDGHIQVYVLR